MTIRTKGGEMSNRPRCPRCGRVWIDEEHPPEECHHCGFPGDDEDQVLLPHLDSPVNWETERNAHA